MSHAIGSRVDGHRSAVSVASHESLRSDRSSIDVQTRRASDGEVSDREWSWWSGDVVTVDVAERFGLAAASSERTIVVYRQTVIIEAKVRADIVGHTGEDIHGRSSNICSQRSALTVIAEGLKDILFSKISPTMLPQLQQRYCVFCRIHQPNTSR